MTRYMWYYRNKDGGVGLLVNRSLVLRGRGEGN